MTTTNKTKNFSITNGELCHRATRNFSAYPATEEPEVIEDLEAEIKSFSVATIKTRLKQRKFSPKARALVTIRDYKNYYRTNKDKMTAEELQDLQAIFLEDIMSLMTMVSPDVKAGKSISTLLGLQAISKEANDIARKMSIVYKKALEADEALGDVPKSMYIKLTKFYNEFIAALRNEVFGTDTGVPLIQKVN